MRFGYRLLPPVVVSATRSNVDEAFARGVSVALDAGMKLTAELSLVGSFSYAWAERHRFIDADIERQEVLLRLGLKCVPAALF